MGARIVAVERLLGRRVDDLTEADLRHVTEAKVSETDHLDFKALLDGSDRHRDGLASDVCAFANAGGGVIVYGIGEDDDDRGRADHLSPFAKPAGELRLKLRGVLSSRVRPMPAFDVRWIDSEEEGVGYLVVSVPASGDAPHAVLRSDQTSGNWLQFPVRRDTATEHLTESDIAARYERRFRTAGDRQAQAQRLLDGLVDAQYDEPSAQLSLAAVPLNPGALTIDDDLRFSLQKLSFGQCLSTRSFGIDPQLHSHAQRFVQRGIRLDHPDGTLTFYSDGSMAATAQLDREVVAGYDRHRQKPCGIELNWMCVRLAGLLAIAADVSSDHAGCAGDLLVSIRLNSLTAHGTPRALAAIGQDHPQGLMTFLRGEDFVSGPIRTSSFVGIEILAGPPTQSMVQEIQRVAADITQALNVATPIGITPSGAINPSEWGHRRRHELVIRWTEQFGIART